LPELSGPLQAGVAPRRPEYHEPDPHHVWVVAFAPEGGLLALGTAGMGVLLWDVAGCQLRRRLNTKAAVRSVAFSGDGRLVAAAEATRVQVWEGESGRAVATLTGHKKGVECVAFSPESGASGSITLLSGSEDGTVRVWDPVSGRERAAFSWPTDKVRAVTFAPDGMTAAAAGQNGQIVLWDIDEG
jgi:WD40 repeat protein